jgi:hypothetical protein
MQNEITHQNKKRSSQHVYDYVIIGAGLSGLIVASALSKETDNIALIEAQDFIGGFNKPVKNSTGTINHGLRYVPDLPSAHRALEFVSSLIGQEISTTSQELPPVTYESGQFKEFVGFGNNSPDFYEELAYFMTSSRLNVNIEPHAWPALLASKYTGDLFNRSYVTKINFTDGRATDVVINGSKNIHGQNFIYCASLKDLAVILPDGVISARAKQKLSKNIYWTGVGLDLVHTHEVTESRAIHILNGTTQDEIGPCAGAFHSPVLLDDGALQTSQWLTYVDEEATEDSEVVAVALKKIKRQIKRAYPSAFENLKSERIAVTPNCAGSVDIKRNANQSLPGAENLWLCSHQLHPQRNLIGAIGQAQLVLAAMGFGSNVEMIDHQVPTAEQESSTHTEA